MTAGYEGQMIGTEEFIIEKPRTETRYVFFENEAQIQYFHGGNLLKEGSTYNDFYGEMTCVTGRGGAVEHAKEVMEYYSITPASDLEIRIVLITNRILKKKTGRKQVFSREEDEYESIGSSQEIRRCVIWSSHDPETILDPKPFITCPDCHSVNGYAKLTCLSRDEIYYAWTCGNCGYTGPHKDGSDEAYAVMVEAGHV